MAAPLYRIAAERREAGPSRRALPTSILRDGASFTVLQRPVYSAIIIAYIIEIAAIFKPLRFTTFLNV
jgi:hypothetical protein